MDPDTIRTWTGAASDGDWNNAANWLEGELPTAGSNVILRDSAENIDTNLYQADYTLATFTQMSSYTGQVGTDTASLHISCPVIDLGLSAAVGTFQGGSGRMKIRNEYDDAIITVHSTASTASASGEYPVELLLGEVTPGFLEGSSSSSGAAGDVTASVYVRSGSVAICREASFSATLDLLSMGQGSPNVYCGRNVTLTALKAYSGTILNDGNVVNADIYGGTATLRGDGGISSIDMWGGTVYPEMSGTLAALNVYGGLADLMSISRARTITNASLRPGGRMNLDLGVITFTNPISSDQPVTLEAR